MVMEGQGSRCSDKPKTALWGGSDLSPMSDPFLPLMSQAGKVLEKSMAVVLGRRRQTGASSEKLFPTPAKLE